jgi:hypothetical protein
MLPDLLRIYPNLGLLPSNFQVRDCAAYLF